MSNATLDDLFTWAAHQSALGNQVFVQFAMTSNDPAHNNVVSYSEAKTLQYFPEVSHHTFLTPAHFLSTTGGVTQYFSDQRYPDTGSPFSPQVTDKLTVSITKVGLSFPPPPGPYSVTLKSSNVNLETTFFPQSDPATGVLTGVVIGTAFVTISLCNRSAVPPGR